MCAKTENKLDLAVVVPTYQERENVAEFIRRLEMRSRDFPGS
jgi:hypothetical protein